MTSSNRHITVILVLVLAASTATSAQEVFRASWTIQDRLHGLQQQIARNLIERANDWLTRESPSAPTARLDDPVRVTIVGEMAPPPLMVRTRLAKLVLGTIVINGQFEEFLDTATISSIVRRDHYWRDESYVLLNEIYSPAYAQTEREPGWAARSDAFGRGNETSRFHIGVAESYAMALPELKVWGGVGFEELGLPDFTYGKARIGIAYNGLKVWGELPLEVGTIDNPVIARGLQGSFGAGLRFESNRFSGSVTWGDAGTEIQAPAVAGRTTYTLDRSALAQLRLFDADAPFLNGSFRLTGGAGYWHLVRRNLPAADAHESVRDIDRVLPMIRGEFASFPSDNGGRSRVAAQILGDGFAGSYEVDFNRTFGLRLSLAAYGLLGDLPAYLPRYSVLLSPTISF